MATYHSKRPQRKMVCHRCGRELQPGEWSWSVDQSGNRIVLCKDDRRCWPKQIQHSAKLKVLLRNQKRWGWMA